MEPSLNDLNVTIIADLNCTRSKQTVLLKAKQKSNFFIADICQLKVFQVSVVFQNL